MFFWEKYIKSNKIKRLFLNNKKNQILKNQGEVKICKNNSSFFHLKFYDQKIVSIIPLTQVCNYFVLFRPFFC